MGSFSQNRRHRCPPPTCSHFVSKTSLKKPTINPWENYYSRPSFTKSTSLPTTIVEKKKKMNGVIYYLLMSFTAKKRRKNKAKSTKQTLSRLSQTGRTNFVCQQSSA